MEAKAFIISKPHKADIRHSEKLIEQAQKIGKIKTIFEDSAFDSAQHTAQLLEKGIKPVIRPRIYGSLQENIRRLKVLLEKHKRSSSES